MPRIIAFSGKMGSGKSEAVKILQGLLGTHRVHLLKFAQPLYDIQDFIQERLSMPYEKDRKLLQWLGTDWGKAKNPAIWANLWKQSLSFIKHRDKLSAIVCDDCRFEDEAEVVKEHGGIIVHIDASRETRSLRISVEGEEHASESGISTEYYDYVIDNNMSREDLEDSIKAILAREGIRCLGGSIPNSADQSVQLDSSR